MKQPKIISETWNSSGQLHSFHDKPSLVREDGCKHWYKDGKWHRENGPAIIWNENKGWFWEGEMIK